MLGSWLEDLAANSSPYIPSCLYHTLDYSYTEAAVSLKALKAEDYARVQTLRELADELPFQVYLALIERMEQGETSISNPGKRPRFDCDEPEDEDAGYHFIEEVLEEDHLVKSLHTLDGKIVARDYDLKIDNFLEDEPFDGITGIENDFEPYQGNWVCILFVSFSIVTQSVHSVRIYAFTPPGPFSRPLVSMVCFGYSATSKPSQVSGCMRR
jgi:hypothetical protein